MERFEDNVIRPDFRNKPPRAANDNDVKGLEPEPVERNRARIEAAVPRFAEVAASFARDFANEGLPMEGLNKMIHAIGKGTIPDFEQLDIPDDEAGYNSHLYVQLVELLKELARTQPREQDITRIRMTIRGLLTQYKRKMER